MELSDCLNKFTDCEVKTDMPLKEKNSYKTGGTAKYFIVPHSVKGLSDALFFLREKKQKYFVLGGGTNVLFSDKGFDGAILSLSGIKGLKAEGEIVTARAGEKISSLCAFARENSLSGLEELFGIPGSVGGAVKMNAGAFKKSVSDLIISVKTYKNGKIIRYLKSECGFVYRKSRFNSQKEIIVSADFKLFAGDKKDIDKKTEKFALLRASSQPKGLSAGSVFKNPEGRFSAKLIEEAGLKGLRIGGAAVSDKHANFILNDKNATSEDIYGLIKTVKEKIKEKYGIILEEEIIYVGEF